MKESLKTIGIKHNDKIYQVKISCPDDIIRELKERYNIDFNNELIKGLESQIKHEMELLDADKTTK